MGNCFSQGGQTKILEFNRATEARDKVLQKELDVEIKQRYRPGQPRTWEEMNTFLQSDVCREIMEIIKPASQPAEEFREGLLRRAFAETLAANGESAGKDSLFNDEASDFLHSELRRCIREPFLTFTQNRFHHPGSIIHPQVLLRLDKPLKVGTLEVSLRRITEVKFTRPTKQRGEKYWDEDRWKEMPTEVKDEKKRDFNTETIATVSQDLSAFANSDGILQAGTYVFATDDTLTFPEYGLRQYGAEWSGQGRGVAVGGTGARADGWLDQQYVIQATLAVPGDESVNDIVTLSDQRCRLTVSFPQDDVEGEEGKSTEGAADESSYSEEVHTATCEVVGTKGCFGRTIGKPGLATFAGAIKDVTNLGSSELKSLHGTGWKAAGSTLEVSGKITLPAGPGSDAKFTTYVNVPVDLFARGSSGEKIKWSGKFFYSVKIHDVANSEHIKYVGVNDEGKDEYVVERMPIYLPRSLPTSRQQLSPDVPAAPGWNNYKGLRLRSRVAEPGCGAGYACGDLLKIGLRAHPDMKLKFDRMRSVGDGVLVSWTAASYKPFRPRTDNPTRAYPLFSAVAVQPASVTWTGLDMQVGTSGGAAR